MVNYKKRPRPVPKPAIDQINFYAPYAAMVRGHHDSGHAYFKARMELARILSNLVFKDQFTPAQIAEETSLSYRTIRRYLSI